MMRKHVGLLVTLVLSGVVHAQDPPQVLIFGVFHFSNPGLDVVQVDQIDVSTPENQTYLDELAERLCAFKPTAILLEFDRSREQDILRELETYLAGAQGLSTNEIQQIGFRVAEACGVTTIYGFDENEIQWSGQVLFEYLERSEPELLETTKREINQIQAAEAAAHAELGLRELLIRANDPELDRLNMDFYLQTNVAGAGSSFEGADAAASWWHRNFRMYAGIQKHARPGERLLVVAGQGHTAILRTFLEIDRRIVPHDIHPYL